MSKRYRSFNEFYPFYLSQHQHPISTGLHYLGNILVILLILFIFYSGRGSLVLILPIVGYGPAWLGHFFFEKNKPATFQYPVDSLMGDWRMFFDAIRQKFMQ